MSLRLIPPGSTIERTYYAVPGYYGLEREFDTFEEARDYAVQRRDEHLAVSVPETVANRRCVVDLRWVIAHPEGSTDTTIERISVAHLKGTVDA